jgi:hypothetical protein
MEIVELRYDRTKNLGDYNSEKTGATAVVSAGDNPNKCMLELKAFVCGIGSVPVESSVEVKPVEPIKVEVEPAPKAVLKSEGKKVHGNSKEAKELNKDKPKKADVEIDSVIKAEEPKPEPVVVVEEKPLKRQKPVTMYDRNNDLHKKILSEMLDVKFKGWRSNPSKAKQVSIELEGLEFLDGEGITLKSFIIEVEKKMG